MSNPVYDGGAYKLISLSTAQQIVRTGPWQLIGLFVSAGSAGGFEIYDAVSTGSATAVAVFTVNTGTFYSMRVQGANGLTVRASGTVIGTLMWNPLG